jgi:dTDP-4-amino-4,6-dideoxygalactose transaminase
MRLLRSWGEERRYDHQLRGFNYRMDGIQGAVLGVKLKHLERWTEARRRIAGMYTRLLRGSAAECPQERPAARHVYHVYAVRVPGRDAWRARLTASEVQTGIHYPTPIHLQPAYRDLGYEPGAFPVSERLAGEVLSLPMFPELTDDQIAAVAGLFHSGRHAPSTRPVTS